MARIDTVLIANRGEIACRVIRACRETQRRAVAVYSEADREALHVRLADEAVCLGAPAASASYLDVNKVIAAAKQTGAQAIHPGYGFLAEKEDAARAVEEAGLIWIGPQPDVIAALGDKVQARKLAMEAGVPVIPGSEGAVSAEEAAQLAPEIGFPVLLKAAGGGGGKGIRLVESAETLVDDLARAAGEAQSAFGASAVYLEKCISPARHIEVQVIGDGQGDAVHLGERECSLQRRQQKVLEETPSVAISADLRRQLGDAAVAVAKASKYRGAGTVEFLVDEQGGFFFLEVNARLQVEHPITEMVTGVDLVRAQLHVAETGALPLQQSDWQPRGHAIELRVNAEDPFQGFVPSIGRVEGLQLPAGPFVRVDTGLSEGDEVTPYYDSLLAKLVVWGRDREEALERLVAAVRSYRISGLSTTLPLVPLLAADEDFRAARFHTAWLSGWMEQHAAEARQLSDDEATVAAVAAAVAEHERRQGRGAGAVDGGRSAPTVSPWVLFGRNETFRRS
jgi:acetyl-CoA carboxylase biotin carboxylase subunit